MAGSEEDSGGNLQSSSGDDNKMEEMEEVSLEYIILKEESVREIQENDILKVSEELSISRGKACSLLIKENWCPTSAVQKWRADSPEEEEPEEIFHKNYCGICMEKKEMDRIMCLEWCGHPFCIDCWKNYVSHSIEDGCECLKLRCPEKECKSVALDMVERLASADEKDRFLHFLFQSYVERSEYRKWCPAPGCDYAVEFPVGGRETYAVECDCSHKFCWNCSHEFDHQPANCETVMKWMDKMSSRDVALSKTKPCPKCKRPIKKDKGCNHMTCVGTCGFEFCWLCFEDMEIHVEDDCPGYTASQSSISTDEEESSSNEEESPRRYPYWFCLERWASHSKSRDIAVVDMSRAKDEIIPVLMEVQREAEASLKCVVDAWEEIVECRQVLKWTYAYAYYIDEDKLEEGNEFSEALRLTEVTLEKLHKWTEIEMKKYMDAHSFTLDFVAFRRKLTYLTINTGIYILNLKKAIEKY